MEGGLKSRLTTLLPAIKMDYDVLKQFLKEPVIPMACKFGDYLPVLLDVRQVSQIVVPAELPDAAVLGATIDNRFRSTIDGTGTSQESLVQQLKRKASRLGRKDKAKETRMKSDLLRELYTEVVENSVSYKVYMEWIEKLGLEKKILESRPTIREVYIFKDISLAVELEELQDMRKDIRWDFLRAHDRSVPPTFWAFPEELSPAFLRKLGDLLGYPACCIDRYIFDRSSGILSPEVRAANQIIHAESPEEVDKFAYFTKDFFPCQPDCERAAEIGRNMYERVKRLDADLGELYLEYLSDNVNLIRQYPEIIEEKARRLEREREGFQRQGDDVEDER
jgi:hypothetical protein